MELELDYIREIYYPGITIGTYFPHVAFSAGAGLTLGAPGWCLE